MFLINSNYFLTKEYFYFYIENPIIYIYSKLAIIKVLTNSKDIYISSLNSIERYVSIFGSIKYTFALSSVFNNCVYGITKRFRVVGRGYKTHARTFVISNKLGYSHLLFTVLPLQYRFGKRKRKDKLNFWRIFGTDVNKLGNYLYTIEQYKIPNVYTKKGIYSWGKVIFFKEGKKAYVL